MAAFLYSITHLNAVVNNYFGFHAESKPIINSELN